MTSPSTATSVPANAQGQLMAYVGAVYESGTVVSGDGLLPPSTATTTLRVRGDKRQVQDGPFADTKEQLGGYFVLEVPDLDSALEWAARAPCASTGGVEVRPVMPRDGMPVTAEAAARRAAERAARDSYGRLLSILSASHAGHRAGRGRTRRRLRKAPLRPGRAPACRTTPPRGS